MPGIPARCTPGKKNALLERKQRRKAGGAGPSGIVFSTSLFDEAKRGERQVSRAAVFPAESGRGKEKKEKKRGIRREAPGVAIISYFLHGDWIEKASDDSYITYLSNKEMENIAVPFLLPTAEGRKSGEEDTAARHEKSRR